MQYGQYVYLNAYINIYKISIQNLITTIEI